jgi:hypothetical protein
MTYDDNDFGPQMHGRRTSCDMNLLYILWSFKLQLMLSMHTKRGLHAS